MFYDPGHFPFTRALHDRWRAVRSELEQLDRSDFAPWEQVGAYAGGAWDMVPLYAPPHPEWEVRMAENRRRCPLTARALASIEGMFGGGFSLLAPGTSVHDHHGVRRGVLRFHLGLHIPPGCSITVAGKTRTWNEGEWLVFDDTEQHAARNDGDSDRIVLLVDVDARLARRPVPEPLEAARALRSWAR